MTVNSLNENQTSEPPLNRPKPVVLLLLDGLGVASPSEANAIAAAKTPTWLNLIKEYPTALLAAGDNKTLNARYLTLGAGQEIAAENTVPAVTLTAILSQAGLKQTKIAETERFAALTHFFNGHREDKAAREAWEIISSEAGDHTNKPSLALKRTIAAIIKEINRDDPADFLIAAIPYLDLVAAGGDWTLVKKAMETIDQDLKKILTAMTAKKGVLIISAACGNAEKMGVPGTEIIDKDMTDNPVPILIIGEEFKGKTIGLTDPLDNDLSLLAPAGTLADLAPTILRIMGLKQPPEMTGNSLIEK